MRQVVVLLLIGCTSPPPEKQESPVVIDNDDRYDVYAHEDSWLRDLARQSVAAWVNSGYLDRTDPTNVTMNMTSIGSAYNLCAGERFYNDPAISNCTATLIDDDLVLTEAHCSPSGPTPYWLLVFNYLRDQPGSVNHLTSDDVYGMKAVKVFKNDNTTENDYAIVQLDRPATPRYRPAPVALGPVNVTVGAPVAVIGTPTGAPLKIDSGAYVTSTTTLVNHFHFFSDIFHGNSGGPVIDLATHTVLGTVDSFGDVYTDYTLVGSCNVTTKTPSEGHSPPAAEFAQDAINDYCSKFTNPRLCGGVPRNDTPATAELVELRDGNEAVLWGSTDLANKTMTPSCGSTGTAPDVFYKFTLPVKSMVYADSFSSTFDTVLFLTQDTDHQTTGYACNDDACSSVKSQLTQRLEPGTYYLGVTGYGGARGRFGVHLSAMAMGANTALNTAGTSVAGSTVGTVNAVTPTCASSSAPDYTYYYTTCPGAMTRNDYYSTCGGASWDTILQYRDANTPGGGTCVDDSYGCDRQSSFYATRSSGSGLHAITVDGYGSASGSYTLGYTTTPVTLHSDNTATLPARGTATGTSFIASCSSGYVMVGLQLSYATAVNGVAPVCGELKSDGSIGASYTGTVSGSTTGTTVTDRCPVGQMMVGLYGNAGTQLDRVGVVCAYLYPWLNMTQGTRLPLHGNSAETAYFDTCYSGQGVTSLTGWQSGGIKQLGAACKGVY